MSTAHRKPTLAVVGATGAVGSVLLHVLSERADVWGDIVLLDVESAAGQARQVRGEDAVVLALRAEAFDDVDVAIFHVPEEVAARWAPVAVARGAVVVDSSFAFRLDPDVPLVVPEINAAQAANRPKGIIASPNSTTMALMDVLGALHARWGLTGVVVATYQAASGVGTDGVERLLDEVDALRDDRSAGSRTGAVRRGIDAVLGDESPFPDPLALNVVPWVGDVAGKGWSTEELQVRAETRKVLDRPHLRMSITCVRVPVVTSHSLAVHATFERSIKVAEARRALVQAPHAVVFDDAAMGEWPTPIDVVGSNPTFVGRLRQSLDYRNTLEMFVSGDNLRSGGALNAAEIGELVCAELAPR